MLSSKHRLAKDEVKEVFDKGLRKSNQYGSIVFLKSTVCRAAIVVSKKVAGSAVVRNKIRRRIYSVIGNAYSLFYPYHFAVLPNQKFVQADNKEAIMGLIDLFDKARIRIS